MNSLHDYGQECAKKYGPRSYKWVREIKRKQKENICVICDKQLEMYTSKKGNIYLANFDHSPHRKGLNCVDSWSGYNGN